MFHLQLDYYSFLKLRRNASFTEIVNAFQKKREHILALYPAEIVLRQKLLSLNKMESILLDPEARAKYNSSLPPEKPMDADDYYELLNISRDASSEEIMTVFEVKRQLYRQEQNKVGDNPVARRKLAEKLKENEEAKDFLLRKRRREKDDLSLKSQRIDTEDNSVSRALKR